MLTGAGVWVRISSTHFCFYHMQQEQWERKEQQELASQLKPVWQSIWSWLRA